MPAQVGERRRFGDQIAEWDGSGWTPVEAPEPEASDLEQVGSRVWDQVSMVPGVGPALNAIDVARGKMNPTEYAARRGVDAGEVLATVAGGPLLKAAGRGIGAAVGYGVENSVLGGAAKEGVRAALQVPKGTKMASWLTAKIKHAVGRGAKEAAEEAAPKGIKAATDVAGKADDVGDLLRMPPKAAPKPQAPRSAAPKGKAAPKAPDAPGKAQTPYEAIEAAEVPSPEQIQELVLSEIKNGYSAGQVADTLYLALRGVGGSTPYRAKQMVTMILQAHPEALAR